MPSGTLLSSINGRIIAKRGTVLELGHDQPVMLLRSTILSVYNANLLTMPTFCFRSFLEAAGLCGAHNAPSYVSASLGVRVDIVETAVRVINTRPAGRAGRTLVSVVKLPQTFEDALRLMRVNEVGWFMKLSPHDLQALRQATEIRQPFFSTNHSALA